MEIKGACGQIPSGQPSQATAEALVERNLIRDQEITKAVEAGAVEAT
jgi:hypothetical protein